jgi:hypothetical protein
MPENWEQYVERIKKLPRPELEQEVDRLSLVWSADWELFLGDMWQLAGQPKSKVEWEAERRQEMQNAFGYVGRWFRQRRGYGHLE